MNLDKLDLNIILAEGSARKASDIHITTGKPVMFRIDGEMIPYDDYVLKPEDTEKLVYDSLKNANKDKYEEYGELDYSYSISEGGRYRVNAYKQRGSCAMVLRIIPMTIPTIDKLGLPDVLKDMAKLPRGLILVTGPTGSGKSTTLAAMIGEINNNKSAHILTLEDPIEYLHKHNMSVINQREIGSDSKSFANGLRAALRQDPDVILVGEMRDLETIEIALTAAETGHLVLSTLHTNSAAKTVDRIIGVFPPSQQQQIRVQLSSVMSAIICQQLLPRADGNGRVGAYEIMIATPAIRNLIREEKIHQINSAIETGHEQKMQTMDASLVKLYNDGLITKDTAYAKAMDLEYMKRYLY